MAAIRGFDRDEVFDLKTHKGALILVGINELTIKIILDKAFEGTDPKTAEIAEITDQEYEDEVIKVAIETKICEDGTHVEQAPK